MRWEPSTRLAGLAGGLLLLITACPGTRLTQWPANDDKAGKEETSGRLVLRFTCTVPPIL